MNPSDMNDEQLRIAVAEALGGYSNAWCPCGCANHVLLKNSDRSVAPKWPRDLNACHEFEKARGYHNCGKFGVFNAEAYAYWNQLKNVEPDRLYATARQRCIALLAVLKPE